jgi:hypothetical protein
MTSIHPNDRAKLTKLDSAIAFCGIAQTYANLAEDNYYWRNPNRNQIKDAVQYNLYPNNPDIPSSDGILAIGGQLAYFNQSPFSDRVGIEASIDIFTEYQLRELLSNFDPDDGVGIDIEIPTHCHSLEQIIGWLAGTVSAIDRWNILVKQYVRWGTLAIDFFDISQINLVLGDNPHLNFNGEVIGASFWESPPDPSIDSNLSNNGISIDLGSNALIEVTVLSEQLNNLSEFSGGGLNDVARRPLPDWYVAGLYPSQIQSAGDLGAIDYL